MTNQKKQEIQFLIDNNLNFRDFNDFWTNYYLTWDMNIIINWIMNYFHILFNHFYVVQSKVETENIL